MYRRSPYLLVVHHLIWLGNGIVSVYHSFRGGQGRHLELGPAWQNFHFTIPESLECGTLTRALEGELEEGAILGEGGWLQETRGSQGRGMTSSLHTDVLGVHRRMGGEHGGAREGGTH